MDIEKLIECLNSNLPKDIQEKAMEKLIFIEEKKIPMLMRPKSKPYWGNAALVVKRIGYPKVKDVIPNMLEWIADLTWPGAEVIFELLSSIDKDILVSYIEQAIVKAKAENDEEWLFSIKMLVRKVKLIEDDFVESTNYKLIDSIES